MFWTKSRKRSITMSTEKTKKKKRRFRKFEWIRIVEYGLIALVVLAFIGLAIFYGTRRKALDGEGENAGVDVTPSASETPLPSATPLPTATPEPTADPSIRGMNVLDALERAGFTVVYTPSQYNVTAPNQTAFTMHMYSDNRGIRSLDVETPLCPDPEGDSVTARMLREENERTVTALRELFDCLMRVFDRTVADSDTIVSQCLKVVQSGSRYSKHLGHLTVRIDTVFSGPGNSVQSVTVQLERDP